MLTLQQAKEAFAKFLNSYDQDASLMDIHSAFVLERMRMDKYFSDYLQEHEKSMATDEDYSNESWQTYKKKLAEYNDNERNITHSKYYLDKHVR